MFFSMPALSLLNSEARFVEFQPSREFGPFNLRTGCSND
jgi:hypothetical protein